MEQEQLDGRFLKHIKFRFPVYFNDSEIEELSWDNESTVETVVGLQRKDTCAESNRSCCLRPRYGEHKNPEYERE